MCYSIKNLRTRYIVLLWMDYKPLDAIQQIVNHPIEGINSYLPVNMKQRIADLLQLCLVQNNEL